MKRRLVIVVDHTGTSDLVQKAYDEAALNPQYAEPWIVFDRDRVPDFDKIISEAEEKGIIAGWSNPCIEIWLNAYFGTMPSYDDSVKCCKGFADKYAAMTNQSYSKADKDLYSKLRKYGDEESAIKIAERRIKQYERNGVKKPSEMYSATTLHKLVQEVNCKINKHSAVI